MQKVVNRLRHGCGIARRRGTFVFVLLDACAGRLEFSHYNRGVEQCQPMRAGAFKLQVGFGGATGYRKSYGIGVLTGNATGQLVDFL